MKKEKKDEERPREGKRKKEKKERRILAGRIYSALHTAGSYNERNFTVPCGGQIGL